MTLHSCYGPDRAVQRILSWMLEIKESDKTREMALPHPPLPLLPQLPAPL